MVYPDIIKIAEVASDGYGDRTVTRAVEVQAAFIKRSGYVHSSNSEGETSDAAVYLDPYSSDALSFTGSLEGMYIQAEPFDGNSWYRVQNATVAKRKLLNNRIDNIYCRLEKVAGIAYVPIS